MHSYMKTNWLNAPANWVVLLLAVIMAAGATLSFLAFSQASLQLEEANRQTDKLRWDVNTKGEQLLRAHQRLCDEIQELKESRQPSLAKP